MDSHEKHTARRNTTISMLAVAVVTGGLGVITGIGKFYAFAVPFGILTLINVVLYLRERGKADEQIHFD